MNNNKKVKYEKSYLQVAVECNVDRGFKTV